MVVNNRPFKKMKRRVTADLNDFLTFPSAEHAAGKPFRTTVREFLLRHALLPPPSSVLPHLLTWQVLFRVGEQNGDDSVCLDVVEEDVIRSRSVYCDQCRVVGELTQSDSVVLFWLCSRNVYLTAGMTWMLISYSY
ncbi:hypothetical protein HanLR1_Chr03g0118481 [Helianthus annuus]|nr:hypothetical protein HanLR1_Chr03g0118481 [Helianthus annuus]